MGYQTSLNLKVIISLVSFKQNMNLKIKILAGNTLMSRFHVDFEIELPLIWIEIPSGLSLSSQVIVAISFGNVTLQISKSSSSPFKHCIAPSQSQSLGMHCFELGQKNSAESLQDETFAWFLTSSTEIVLLL